MMRKQDAPDGGPSCTRRTLMGAGAALSLSAVGAIAAESPGGDWSRRYNGDRWTSEFLSFGDPAEAFR